MRFAPLSGVFAGSAAQGFAAFGADWCTVAIFVPGVDEGGGVFSKPGVAWAAVAVTVGVGAPTVVSGLHRHFASRLLLVVR